MHNRRAATLEAIAEELNPRVRGLANNSMPTPRHFHRRRPAQAFRDLVRQLRYSAAVASADAAEVLTEVLDRRMQVGGGGGRERGGARLPSLERDNTPIRPHNPTAGAP